MPSSSIQILLGSKKKKNIKLTKVQKVFESYGFKSVKCPPMTHETTDFENDLQ